MKSAKKDYKELNVSDKWRDYELIDVSDGERLERWGDAILVRPDPQVIWSGIRNSPKWESYNGRYIRSDTGGGHWDDHGMKEKWTIAYGALKLMVKPMGFKHTGIFPEQAYNWDRCSGLISASGRHVSVLNLFAYTGCATMACAAAGADVCHVDASKGMVAQAKENAALCNLSGAPIRYIVDDCIKFCEREIRRGHKYDAIIMDPPSYGRGPGGELWKLEESIFPFIQLAASLLSDNPLFFLLNSYTTGLSAGTMAYMISTALKAFPGQTEAYELGLHVSRSGLSLPCGSSALRVLNP
ncbi:MAG: class I SAM-dependent methyltransferase [Oscillospiraceae bacterium]|nr:class I SAM-dependent methyltransferase [Oscillospiraceae bacterium]